VVHQQLADDARDMRSDAGHLFEALDAPVLVHDRHRNRPVAHGRCRLHVGTHVALVGSLTTYDLGGLIQPTRNHPV